MMSSINLRLKCVEHSQKVNIYIGELMKTSRIHLGRFGDPVLSLAMNHENIAGGSAFGCVFVYNYSLGEYHCFSEVSEEHVPSVLLTANNAVYFAVGDYYCGCIFPLLKTTRPAILNYSREHLPDDCSKSLTFFNNNHSCLVPTNGGNILILDLFTRVCSAFDPLPVNSLPLDYYNDKVLIEYYQKSGKRQFAQFCFRTSIVEEMIQFPKEFGHVTNVRMCRDGIVFVHNYQSLKVWKYVDEMQQVSWHRNRIAAYGIFENEDAIWVGVLHIDGMVRVFKDWDLNFEGVVEYQNVPISDFDLNYPYVLSLYPPALAFSTDSSVYLSIFPN
jgi:hypothetical protein